MYGAAIVASLSATCACPLGTVCLMASNTRVEWMLWYENGNTQEVSITHDDNLHIGASVLQQLARERGATLLRRTITTTEWTVPDGE